MHDPILKDRDGYSETFSDGWHPEIQDLQIVNFANEWGLTLIGLALILGIFTRVASWAGIAMLTMYYLAYPPFGGFSYGAATEGSYLIVNKNLIELVCLLILAFTRSGRFFGLEQLLERKKEILVAEPVENAQVTEPETNRRRELIKGLAGVPVLAAFGGAFLREMSRPGVDGVSSATLPQVTYKRISDLKTELPKGKLGDIELSRMIMGCNLISGYAHARDLIYANTLFKAYNTDQKILETFHLAEMAGITCIISYKFQFPDLPEVSETLRRKDEDNMPDISEGR